MKLSKIVEKVVKESEKKIGDPNKIEITVKAGSKLEYYLLTTRLADIKERELKKGEELRIKVIGDRGEVEKKKRI